MKDRSFRVKLIAAQPEPGAGESGPAAGGLSNTVTVLGLRLGHCQGRLGRGLTDLLGPGPAGTNSFSHGHGELEARPTRTLRTSLAPGQPLSGRGPGPPAPLAPMIRRRPRRLGLGIRLGRVCILVRGPGRRPALWRAVTGTVSAWSRYRCSDAHRVMPGY